MTRDFILTPNRPQQDPQQDNEASDMSVMRPPMMAPEPPPPEGDLSADAGEKLPEGTQPATDDQIVEALRTVYDPEIPVNIYDLGLIYNVDIKPDGDVSVVMTLTAPACPVAGEMPGEVAEAVAAVDNVGKVHVELTWEPPWTPERMSDEAKIALDMF
ncbi:SUF system Fe-S cluster assembly protein [Caenispirillum salinarum]|uniref:SUF system Fe-S cluster assembly protein n=1 Tax=Caenispirillum salinarum TaxID=859058 RepID=UPI00385007F8